MHVLLLIAPLLLGAGKTGVGGSAYPIGPMTGTVRLDWSAAGMLSSHSTKAELHVVVTADGTKAGDIRSKLDDDVTVIFTGGQIGMTFRIDEDNGRKVTEVVEGPPPLGGKDSLSELDVRVDDRDGYAWVSCVFGMSKATTTEKGQTSPPYPLPAFPVPGDPKDGVMSLRLIRSKIEREGQTIRLRGKYVSATHDFFLSPQADAAAADPFAGHPEVLQFLPPEARKAYEEGMKKQREKSGSSGQFPGTLTVSWDLTTVTVKAVPKASEADRGAPVELNGKESRGEGLTYRWKLEPGCPEGKIVEKEGAQTRVVLLCDTRVSLTVRDVNGNKDTQSIEGRPRKRKWKTQYSQFGPSWFDGGPVFWLVDAQGFATFFGWLGRNRCSLDPAGLAPELDHILHHDPSQLPAAPSWKGDGYTLEETRDPEGPFDQVWYVASSHLQVSRGFALNAVLSPGGGLDVINRDHRGDVAALRQSVTLHERTHGDLMRSRIASKDPALQIEDKIATSEDALKDLADSTLMIEEGELRRATSEEAVGSALGPGSSATFAARVSGGGEPEIHTVRDLHALGTDTGSGP